MVDLTNKIRKNLLLLLCIDVALFTLSYAGAYLLRFDSHIPYYAILKFNQTIIPLLFMKLYIFYKFGLYRGMWRYTSLRDLENIIKATAVSMGSIIVYVLIISRFEGFSRSVFFIDGMLTVFFIGGLRLGIRVFFDYKKKGKLSFFTRDKEKSGQKKKKRIIIIGAGDAGEKILREINDNVDLNYEAIGLLDDDRKKIGSHIHGVKVLGTIESIVDLPEKIDFDEIIIAIPSAPGDVVRRVIDVCNKTGIQCKTLPGMGELIDGKVTVSKIRQVSYEDLLGRDQVKLDMDKIGAYLRERCVLITGAGGSIGSEFCRQVAAFEPEMLVMFDRAESNLYDIEMEMRRLFPKLSIVPVLGSVTSLERIKKLFSTFKPHVVFHAAAYKHVPMMEIHPWEAVYNNIIGTKNMVDVAQQSGVERFVLVSTDKAVRPTNIMGASKRVAEIILQANNIRYMEFRNKVLDHRETKFQTRMIAVRFGNVLGSAGSVIPLFKKQIEHGGPLTITHPEVMRYFMSISEAVQLILEAGAIGESGDVYILKMGKPVKIVDMARDLIRLSGFEPDRDIRIKFTGLRPGEKLYEELITEGEGIVPTVHNKIMVLRSNANCGDGMNCAMLYKNIQDLVDMSDAHDAHGIKCKLKEVVPEYTPQFVDGKDKGDMNSKFKKADKAQAGYKGGYIHEYGDVNSKR